MNISRAFLFASVFFCLGQKSQGATIETLFSPDDKPALRLIKEIDETKDRILAAIYYISHQGIIDALIRAHERNVRVRIISDAQTSHAIYSKVHQLTARGIPVFVHNLKKKSTKPARVTRAGFARYRLMHDKFAVLDNKVWTGSFNWTIGANNMNFENVVIIQDEGTRIRFLNRFFEIQDDSIPFVPVAAKKLIFRLNPILAQA